MKRHDREASAARALWLIALLALSGCAASAPVVQGKVVAADLKAKVITVQDELRPNDAAVTFDLAEAEMGTPPVTGDQVRLVYRTIGGRNRVLRLMNLTQQKERGKEQ